MQHALARHRHRFSQLIAGFVAALTIISFSIATPAVATPTSAEPIAVAAVVGPSGPITVPACTGTTTTSYGTPNTPTGFTFAESSTGAQELRNGKTVMLYGNQGSVYVDSNGNNISNGQGGLPYCGARVLDNGELEVDWRFCTDQGKRGCANESPGSEWTGTPENPLTDEQKLQIANVLIGAPLSSKRDRAMTQLQVWCISDDWAEGSVNTDAKTYFNYNNFQGSETGNDLETRKLSDAEARCDYLPDLTQSPELTLTGPSSAIEANTPAQFVLETNVTTPITLNSTGASSLQLCPVDQDGVTFDGKTLQLSEPGSVTLCASSTATAEVSVTADTGDLPQAAELNLLWNGNRGCQVFADYVEGAKVRLTQTASANFLGSGTFTVTKTFDGVTPTTGDLDDLTIGLSYVVTGGPSLPAGTPDQGRLVLNKANGFTATGPTYPDGTKVSITETGVTGLPAALEQQSASWTVNGQVTSGDTVEIMVGDGSAVAVTLTDTLTEVRGTFEVRKSFATENGPLTPPADTEVDVRWWVQGSDESTAEIITLNVANGFVSLPGTDETNPTLFPLGTTILLEEVAVRPGLPPGVSNVVDWGSNTVPGFDGNRGMVTIAEEWDPTSHTPGGDTSAAEVQLTNGIDISNGSLTVRKLVEDENGDTQPGVGDGPFDDVEILITATWANDPLNVHGSNVLILNSGNNWTAGLGTDLPVGTVVTVEETEIRSSDPSIEWLGTPLWSCANCTPPFENVSGDTPTQSVTIPDASGGGAIPDLAITMTNKYRVITGSFSVEKIVAGEIDRNDERLHGIDFTAQWTSTDPSQPGGELVLSAPDWVAVPVNEAGDQASFPLGTEITLSEVDLPVIPGVVWGDDVKWSIGDEGLDASFTIIQEGSAPSAAISLTNFAELHEGSFSVAKFVHSNAPADTSEARFEVSYRSPGDNPAYEGTLTVLNDGEAFSEAFPAGTELVLEEIVPAPLPGTEGWQTPQFVDLDGNALETPVLITIGDGTDVRVNLINTTIEPDDPGPTPPVPNKPGLPKDPTTADLANTGAEAALFWVWAAISLALILGGTAVVVTSKRRS